MALGVTVDFNANLAKFSGQMDKLAGQLDKFQKQTESMTSRVNSTLAGLGVGISVAGLAAFVKSGIDAADALNDMADRSGIAIEKLAGLEYAVKIGDTSMESFINASNKLSINIGKNAADFERLGITAKDPVEAFKQLADVFSSIEDPQTRAALGAAALGKSYAEMGPLLMQGADGIQALIDKGREMNPVTAEQAQLAGEFNDKLDKMSAQSQGFRVNFALGVLEPLATLAEWLDKDIQKFGLLEGAWRGFVDGYQEFALSGTGGGLSKELDDINRQIAEKKLQLQKAKSGEEFIGEGREVGLQREINRLVEQRAGMEKKISEERRQRQPAASIESKAIQDFIQKNNDAETAAKKSESSAKSAASADQARAKSVSDIIASLQRDIEISSLSESQQRRMLDLSNALKNARGDEIKTITDLVNAKYNQIEIDKRQADQWQQLIDDANSYFDLRKSISDFERSNNVSTSGLSGLIGNVQDQFNAGTISEEQAKALYDRLGRAYNENFIDPAKTGTEALSEYAVQASRNMESAFADFLFDPFDKGMDGMLESFGNTVKRMAAEAASAQLMESLFGKNGNNLSGIFGSVISGIGGLFGGGLNADIEGLIGNSALFANGGIMTSGGPLPLQKYANGGVANRPQLALFGEGRMNEAYVPLPDGRSIPVTMSGDAGGTINNITINVQGGNNPDDTGRRIGEAFIRTIARDEINNAARPGNRLNQTTKF